MEKEVIDYKSEMTFYLRRFYTERDGLDYAKMGILTNGTGSILLATIENLAYMIPEGEYSMSYTKSNAFSSKEPYRNLAGGRVPILNVPNRKGIRIHVGNWANESRGCILLGTHHGNKYVCDSRIAYWKLMTHVVKFNFWQSTLIVIDTDDSSNYSPEKYGMMMDAFKRQGLCLREKL